MINFNPPKPTHPGEVLREDVIKPLNLTVTAAAQMLGVTRKTLSALLNCRAAMSLETLCDTAPRPRANL